MRAGEMAEKGVGRGADNSSPEKSKGHETSEPRMLDRNDDDGHRKRKMDMIFGTWNTRSLYRSGALKEILNEMTKYGIDILAVQEMRWKGSGIFDTRTHTVLRSGKNDKSELGVAFMVRKGMKESILDFKPVNERICLLRLKTRFFNLAIINVHAETEEKDDMTKENFYQELRKVYDTISSNDIKLVIGDLNAKIGWEPIYKDIIGTHSLHTESNDNWLRAIDFASSRGMAIMSTQFPRKDIHKWTWTTPDDRSHNQIDHVLIEKRGASSIKNVRTYRGADCDSDHYLVNVHFRCRIASATNKTARP